MRERSKPNSLLVMISIVVLIGLAGGCSFIEIEEGEYTPPSDGKAITSFAFAGYESYPVSIEGTTITCTVSCDADISSLTAVFTTTGDHVTVDGATQTSGVTSNNFSFYQNAYIVYAEDGTYEYYLVNIEREYEAKWVRVPSSGYYSSNFYSIGVSASGDVYAAGSHNTGNVFGDVSVPLAYTAGTNAMVVKYSSDGDVLWASAPTASDCFTEYWKIAVSDSGQWCAVGRMGEGTVSFSGTGSVSSVDNDYNSNGLIVYGNANGTVSWAKSLCDTEYSYYSQLRGVGIDSDGNILVAGNIGYNNVVMKYDAAGTLLWTYTDTLNLEQVTDLSVTPDGGAYIATESGVFKVTSEGAFGWYQKGYFHSVTSDASGNVYVSGLQGGRGTQTYGGIVSDQGSSDDWNAVLVSYSADGTGRWVRVATNEGGLSSQFKELRVNDEGELAVIGWFTGGSYYEVAGYSFTVSGSDSYCSVLCFIDADEGLLKAIKKVETVVSSGSELYAVSMESVAYKDNYDVYVAGSQSGTDTVEYTYSGLNSGSISVTAPGINDNALLVKY